MALQKSTRTRGFRRRRRTRRKGKNTLLATIGTVKRLIAGRVEKKFNMYEPGSTSVSSIGIGVDLSAQIAQGDTDTTRDGDEIYYKSIRFRGSVLVSDTTNLVRFILFRWKPNSTPSWAALLEGGGPAASDVYRPFRKDYESNYHVVYDKLFTLNTTDSNYRSFGASISGKKLGKKKCKYVAGGTTGIDHLWVFIISDSDAVSHPSINYNIISYYTDS